MKRIAFISEHASPLASLGHKDGGGQNVYVGQLALHLSKMGYAIDIYTRWEDSSQPQVVSMEPGIRVIHVEAGEKRVIPKEELFGLMADFSTNMRSFMVQENLDYQLVHANFFMSGMVAIDLKKALGIPFVITFHALGKVRRLHQKEQDLFPQERLGIEAELVRQADLIIAECPQDKEDLLNLYGAAEEKIEIVPCGFNPEEFFPVDKQVARKQLGLADDEQVILQLGRMVPRKGIDNVIRALPHVTGNKALKLIVVGGQTDDAEMLRLKAIARDLQVTHQVVFEGSKQRRELSMYYNAADIFVTTPWYEPFGITPLEAMACGTPVIGANVGGIKYTVQEGKTGYLVTHNSPHELARRLTDLLGDDAKRLKMGAEAIKRVNRNFTWEKVALQVSGVYQRVLGKTAMQDTEDDVAEVQEALYEAALTFYRSSAALSSVVAEAAAIMSSCLRKGRKILVCGNGGSAAESQHLAAELVGRFEIPERRGLPVISLTADTSILTAWGNDFGFDRVFERQVEAYGQEGDVLIVLSTSGRSENILRAMRAATAAGMQNIAMLGKDGGAAAKLADISLIVPSESTQRIQELHLHLVHLLCTLVEKHLFMAKPEQERETARQAIRMMPVKLGTEAAADSMQKRRYGS
ncbi:phosphoheptose isomerase [Pedobacter yulinensis]|uniref:Phosphoheptose isomerase n=1 Tax=Pedobacter yulinensis TaxID=2126353 RepID=A0A2T3HK35_9SPHI|nr:glycosyltransferase [Pedobacter yulinensis]PST82802.1 phosphoheptose isomerase [Pedobacter yulinensis]